MPGYEKIESLKNGGSWAQFCWKTCGFERVNTTRSRFPTAETTASVIVAIGYVFILYQALVANLPPLLLGIVAVSVIASVWLETLSTNPSALKIHWQWILREDSGKGVWCSLLVPTAVIVSSFKSSTVDDREAMLLMYCVSMMVMSMLASETACSTPMMAECGATETDPDDECICIPAVAVLERRYLVVLIGILVFYGLIVFRLTLLQYSLICLFTLLLAAMLILVPRWLPHSFTMGENIVCCQAFLLFLLSIALGATSSKAPSKVQERTAAEVVVFIQIAVLSCIVVVFVVATFPQCRAAKYFFSMLISVAMAISLPLLYWQLGQNFITWLIYYVSQSAIKRRLFVFWCVSCVAAVAIVYVNSWRIKHAIGAAKRQADGTQVDGSSGGSDADGGAMERRQMSIITRKQFHILVLFVFLPGFVFHKEMLTLASSCALGVFLVAESIHLWRIPPIGGVLHEWLRVFVDERDKGVVLLTPLYLLVGLSTPLWLHPITSGVALSLYSGVLSVGLGDMVAAVVGSRWGKHSWLGSKKTVEGTVASVIAQLLAVAIIFHFGICPKIGWFQVTVAVVLTSLLEAFTSQIDNLVLPLFMYNLLAL